MQCCDSSTLVSTRWFFSNLFVVAFMGIFFLQWSKSLLQDMIVWIVPNDPWMQNRDQLQVKGLTKKSEHEDHNLRWPSYPSPSRQLSTSTPAMSQMERRRTKGLNRSNKAIALEKWVLDKSRYFDFSPPTSGWLHDAVRPRHLADQAKVCHGRSINLMKPIEWFFQIVRWKNRWAAQSSSSWRLWRQW